MVSGLKPDSTQDTPCMRGLMHPESQVVAKRPRVGLVQKYPHWPGLTKKGVRPGEDQRRVPAQASSSSSDQYSKLRGPFQNCPRVASKGYVNISKLINRQHILHNSTPNRLGDIGIFTPRLTRTRLYTSYVLPLFSYIYVPF
ncbi:hypothetical protein AVEN_260599-1 [Araneus ventricosus]|uniref:Uncharacterized protein n=1 Tax=Araneus ventricosus TaxID=182803 RepID=A0A4Y2IHG2_ARAVE|nr:hypothetical protein AVEN_260599-1 [Araneus ventricosus]